MTTSIVEWNCGAMFLTVVMALPCVLGKFTTSAFVPPVKQGSNKIILFNQPESLTALYSIIF